MKRRQAVTHPSAQPPRGHGYFRVDLKRKNKVAIVLTQLVGRKVLLPFLGWPVNGSERWREHWRNKAQMGDSTC